MVTGERRGTAQMNKHELTHTRRHVTSGSGLTGDGPSGPPSGRWLGDCDVATNCSRHLELNKKKKKKKNLRRLVTGGIDAGVLNPP